MNARGLHASLGLIGMLVALAALGCTNDEPGGDSGADDSGADDDASDTDRFATGAPMRVEPTEPGFLSVSPSVFFGTTGESFTAIAALHDSTGAQQPTPDVTWTSNNAEVVTIDATGALTAVALGIAEVIATDTAGRIASATVHVVEVAPDGAVAFGCDPPFRGLTVGETAALGATTWTNAGTEGLRLEVSSADVLAIEGTQIRARAPGVARITAVRTSDGVALDGDCVVAVATAAPAMPGEAGEEVGGCWFIRPPIWYSQPGLSRQLRVGVFRYTWTAAGLAGFRLTQQSPEEVRLGVEGVVSIGGDGLLTSLAPGRARVSGKVEGVTCEPFRTSVAIDVSASWVASCANGDTGSISLARFAPVVVSAHVSENGTSAPTQHVAQVRARGTSCFSNNAEAFSCSADASVVAVVNGTSDNHLCSAGSPCPYVSLIECGGGRHAGGSHITGADRFDANGCTYTRGEPLAGGCGGPSTVGEGEVCLDETTGIATTCADGLRCFMRLPPDCERSSIGTCRPRLYQQGEVYCCQGVGTADADCAEGLQHMSPTPGDCSWSPTMDACLCAPPTAVGGECCTNRDCAGGVLCSDTGTCY